MGGWGSIYNNALISLRTHESNLSRLQEQVIFQSKIVRASDNPTDAYKVLSLQAQGDSIATYIKSLDSTTANVFAGSETLRLIGAWLSKIKEGLVQSASGTYTQDQRESAGDGVDPILDQIISLINTADYMGQYFFSGAAGTTIPYATQVENGSIVGVNYQGSLENLGIPVAPGVEQPGAVVGDEVFRSNERSSPLFVSDPSGDGVTGVSGVAVGIGTSSVRGDVHMDVSHTTTAFQAGKGVTAGTSSASGDTILGNHTLSIRIDGGVNYIKLSGGPEVTFTGGETDLELTNETDEKVYVDLTGWVGVGKPVGAVTLTSNGRMSIDNGASSTVIDFSSNQAVTDSENGRILYVDSSSIVRTGSEPIRVPGTYDLFEVLINARDLLRNTNMDQLEQSRRLGEAIYSLDEVMSGVRQKMSSLSARGNAMESMAVSLEDIRFNGKTRLSRLRDVDLAQLAIDLSRTQTFYEMTLMSVSKVMQTSLLDFI